jgi:hypothetical protein
MAISKLVAEKLINLFEFIAVTAEVYIISKAFFCNYQE